MNKTFFETVIEGHPEFIKGFVSGLIAGKGMPGETFFGDDFEIDEDSPFEMLTRLVGIRQDHTVIIIEGVIMEMLAEALRAKGRNLGMKLIVAHEIEEAAFEFSFETFSREIGSKLDNILTEIPVGVSIEPPYQREEKEEPEGRGVEAYAPLHDYELKAQGRIKGYCEGVFNCHARLKQYEVIELGPITLSHK